MQRSTICRLLLWVSFLAMLSCHRPQSEREVRAEQSARAAKASESTRQHWAYLDRIRQRDAFNSSIERTFLTDQNEPGVVLSSTVTADKVPALMNALLKEMAQKFPQQDVTLRVFTSSTPPRKIGTAHLNGQTGETTYNPL